MQKLSSPRGPATLLWFLFVHVASLKYLGHQKGDLPIEIASLRHVLPWEPQSCLSSKVVECSNSESVFWSFESSLRRGMRYSMSQGEGTSRLCILNKLLFYSNATSSIKIVVLGGSFTAGTFLRCSDSATAASSGSVCSWPGRMKAHLEASTERLVQVSNLAKGGTTTFWAVNNFHRIPADADLVIIDYDINDGALLNDLPRLDGPSSSRKRKVSERELRERLVASSEVLLRLILGLSKRPAVLWVDSFAYDGRGAAGLSPDLANATCAHLNGRGYSLAEARRRVMDAYGVPSIALRDAVFPDIHCPPPASLKSHLWRCSDTCHHPTVESHKFLARLAAEVIVLPRNESERCSTATERSPPTSPLSPGAAEIEVGS